MVAFDAFLFWRPTLIVDLGYDAGVSPIPCTRQCGDIDRRRFLVDVRVVDGALLGLVVRSVREVLRTKLRRVVDVGELGQAEDIRAVASVQRLGSAQVGAKVAEACLALGGAGVRAVEARLERGERQMVAGEERRRRRTIGIWVDRCGVRISEEACAAGGVACEVAGRMTDRESQTGEGVRDRTPDRPRSES